MLLHLNPRLNRRLVDKNHKPGFALALALGLMAFILLLLVSLSTLIQVDSQTQRQQTAIEQARENARFGLLMALAELQRTAGPDQRVTARADILDEAIENPYWTGGADILDEAIENPYWTGVWTTEDYNHTTDVLKESRDALFLRWLVSAPDSDADNLGLAESAVPQNDDGALLIGPGTLGVSADDSKYVRAYTVPIPASVNPVQTGGAAGRFAWWVGDEGVKAPVRIEASSFTPPVSGIAGRIVRQYHEWLAAPKRTATEVLAADPAGSGDPRLPQLDGFATIDQIASLPQLRYMIASADSLPGVTERFHDLTLNSHGLLVNVRDGGLKQDLTYIFANDAEFERYFPVNEAAFWLRQDPDFTLPFDAAIYRGPNMGILRAFHNSYRVFSGNNLPELPRPFLADTNAPSAAAAFGYRLYTVDVETLSPFPTAEGAFPIIARYHLGVGFGYDSSRSAPINPVNAAGTDWSDEIYNTPDLLQMVNEVGLSPGDHIGETWHRPIVYFWPTLMMYNPYSIPITSSSQIQVENLPYLRVSVGGRDPVYFFLNESYGTVNSGAARMTFTLYEGAGRKFLPGEVAVFSMPDAVEVMSYNPATAADPLQPDFDEDGYYYSVIRIDPDSRRTITSDDEDEEVVDPTFNFPAAGHSTWASKERAHNIFSRVTTSDYWGFTMDELWRMIGREGDLIDLSVFFSSTGPYHRVIGGAGAANFDPPFGYGTPSNNHQMPRFVFGRGGLPGGSSYDPPVPDGVSTRQTYPFAASAGNIQSAFVIGLRTLNDNPVPTRFLDGNPRAAIWGQPLNTDNIHETNPAGDTYGRYFGYLDPSQYAPEVVSGEGSPTRLLGFHGSSITSAGQTEMVLFDIPQAPLLSLGQFMHANLSRYDTNPLYAFGNSYVHPYVSQDRYFNFNPTGTRFNSSPQNHVDLSYHLNNELWDRYFFSGINRNLTQAQLDRAILNDPATTNYANAYAPFMNSRIRPLPPVNPGDYLEEFIGTGPSSRVFETVAGNLMLEGAFNVNSTSVDAWRVFLASNNDKRIPRADYKIGGLLLQTEGDPGVVFPRILTALGPENDPWNGYRRLSLDEIDDLAEKIVEQVRLRGPFMSMADFVNRRLISSTLPDAALGNKGALQAAIDESGVNAAVEALGPSAAEIAISYDPDNPDNEFRSVPDSGAVAGIPGFLLQSDILQSLGSVMTVRSDTFRIRAYGETQHPVTGAVIGQAWCEAIVQRLPYPADPINPASGVDELDHLVNPGSAGRQFRIVQFRWLDANEI